MRCGERGCASAVLLAVLVATGCGGEERRPSAVLVTLDTTRADVLGCYGEDELGTVTPVLDALAEQGVLYRDAHTTAPITLPSHASMLTGLYPPRHSVRDNGLWALPDSARTLAERASDAGVQTAAFVASIVLDRGFGLAQGFDHWVQPEREALRASSHATELPARAVVDEAVRWLRAADRDRPLFCWLHLFDPHGPYEPPPRFREGAYARKRGYYGEVAAMDDALGRFFTELDARPEPVTILVVADHGEAFGEYGEESHGVFVFEPTLRVPMLLVRGDGARRGEVSDERVSVVDAFPTLLSALGLDAPSDLDGVDLLEGRVPEERGVYFESYQGHLSFGWTPLSGWLDGRGKSLFGARARFFELEGGEPEAVDRAEERGASLEAHAARIAELTSLPRLEREDAEADAELLDGLRALGYASVGGERTELPEPGRVVDGLDPLARVDEHRRALEALELNNVGRYRDAERILRELLDGNPRNWFALDRLAFALMGLRRWQEAEAELTRLTEEGPRWSHALLNLGFARLRLGRTEAAGEALRSAAGLDPRAADELTAFAAELEREGDGETAAAARALAAELGR